MKCFLKLLNQYVTPAQDVFRGEIYLQELHERVLIALYPMLNKIHGVNYSERYWRILLAPWLQFYLYVVYQRYNAIQACVVQGDTINFQEISLGPQLTPLDTLDFQERLKSDAYNLRLSICLAQKLGLTQVAFAASPLISAIKNNQNIIKHKFLYWNILFFFLRKRKKFLLCSAYMPRKVLWIFMLQSFAKIINLPSHFFSVPKIKFNEISIALRDKIKLANCFDHPFEKLLVGLLVYDIPICFMEGYQHYHQHAHYLKKQLGVVTGILSANAWYSNEAFKQVAALYAEEGVKLYGVQHGGNYGAALFLINRTLEARIVDQYFSWGWSDSVNQKNTVPMPANKLINVVNHVIDDTQAEILFGMTVVPRFDNHFFQLPPVHFLEYLDRQLVFLNNLPENIRRTLILRPHHEDLGWNIKQRLLQHYSDLQIEDWSIPFLDRLKTVRLYVCDHFSTTHMEALAIGMPTILYWCPEHFLLSEEATPYYDGLREVGILFDDPAKAAQAVAAVYDDVESWWMEPKRQQSVSAIVAQYANRSPNAQKKWFKTLMALVNS